MSVVTTATVLDVGAAVAAAGACDLDRAGIPMLLALEGAVPAPVGDPRRADGARLASLLDDVHAHLRALPAPVCAPAEGVASPIGAEEALLAEALAVLALAELAPGGATLASTSPVGAGEDPGGGRLLASMRAALREGRFVRAVNWHNTPAARASALAVELDGLASRCAPLDEDGLVRLFDTGVWEPTAAPVLPVFYEGYRNHAAVAAPALDAVGLVGWFFVITGFVDAPVADQRAFAAGHHIRVVEEEDPLDRLAMTWPEVAEVAGRHVVTAHTATHAPIAAVRTPEDFAREIVDPATSVESATGRPAPAHAWLWGSGTGVSVEHDAALRNAGYRWCFSNTAVTGLRPKQGGAR